jgi:monoamine oxidase
MKLSTIDGGAQQTRLAEGFQTVAQRLAAELAPQLWLSAAVRAVVADEQGVLVHSTRGTVRGKRLILAVPPALAGRIEYTPALPTARDQLTQRMPMGSVAKCVAVYDRPFWRERKFSGEALCDRGPVRIVFDDSPPPGHTSSHGALVAFVLADGLRELRPRDGEARRKAVLAELARLFGPPAGEPLEFIEQDWGSEPWSRGCYFGIMPPGTLTRYGAALRAPCGPIHFAGTETAERWMGYMDGAVESGLRAAREVLPLLGLSGKG